MVTIERHVPLLAAVEGVTTEKLAPVLDAVNITDVCSIYKG